MALKWDVWRFTLYGAAVGILYGLYFGVNHMGTNEWVGDMFVGVVGGAATGAIIAGARNFLLREPRS
jgi:hypothetical protein